MKRLAKNKILLVVMSFFLLFPITRVNATIGNVTTFIYSEDFFPGDKNTITTYYQKFLSRGKPSRLASRSTGIYAMKQELINSESVFISSHGTEIGSVIVLDNTGSSMLLFNCSDVPKNMDGKLAYISVCYSAKNNAATGENLCNTLVKNGYATAIGYKTAVSAPLSRVYENIVIDRLLEGDTVHDALMYARDYLMERSSTDYKNIISSCVVYGDLNLKL